MSNRSERTRQAILNTARRRLSTPGDAARLDDIAKDAGVTRQTLHLHFGSRSALLVAAAQENDAAMGLNEQLSAIRVHPDAREALNMLLRFVVAFEPQVHGVAMAALRESVSDPDLLALWNDRMEDRRKQFKHCVRRLKQEGLLRPGWSAQQVVDLLWEVSAPTSYEHLVVERGWPPDAFERWLLSVARSFVT